MRLRTVSRAEQNNYDVSQRRSLLLAIVICLLSSERPNPGGGGGRSGHGNVLPVINLQSTIDVQEPSFAFHEVV